MPTENAHQRYLAELPNSWSICDLRALGSIVGGSTPSRAISRFWNGNIPWVTPGEMTALVGTKFLNDTRERITRAGYESCGTRLLPPGSLLITTRATLGLVALAGCEVSTNQGFKSVVFCRDNYPDFYFHLFHRLKPEMERLASGTTFLEISAGDFGRITIPVPPPSEQRAIAAVLDSLDDAIQKTEQIIAKLQQVKQGLLHDLLTRGIDDNGELRDPERHPEQFQDSPLGRIPKGWRAESLGSLVTSAVDGPFGSALKSEHYVPQPGVRLVRLQNIGSGEFIDHDHAWISQRYAETLRRHDAVSGDVLVASLGDENHPYGRACVFQDGSWAIVKADCFRLRPTGFMNSDFLAASLNIDVYHRPLRGLAQGVTRDRVNLGNLLRVRLPVPSREEQNSIINMVDSLQRRITCEQNRAQKLRSTKAGLSEDLLTGRVRTTSLPGFSA